MEKMKCKRCLDTGQRECFHVVMVIDEVATVMYNGKPIETAKWPSTRVMSLVKRDGPYCYWCGLHLSPWSEEITIDHVMPRSKGGSNTLKNVVLCCRVCNQAKGDDHPLVWIARLVSWHSSPPPKMKYWKKHGSLYPIPA